MFLCALCGYQSYDLPLEPKSCLILFGVLGYSLEHEQFRPNYGRSPHRHGPSP